MKQRLITGAIFLGILLPLVIINTEVTKSLYIILTMFVCFYSSFEIMRAGYNHNKLRNDGGNLKALKILIPIFSSLLALSTIFATINFGEMPVLSYQYYVVNLITYIVMTFIVMCFLVVIPNTTFKDYGTCFTALTYGIPVLQYQWHVPS